MMGTFSPAIRRAVFTSIGVLALAVLVWYFGPLISINGVAPIASSTARAVVAALVVICVAAALFTGWQRRQQRNIALLAGLADARRVDAGAADVAEIAKRFNAALEWLKSNGVARARSPVAHLAGQSFLYELPWYILIGAPGSGKTTALEASGLEFPLAKSLGRGAIAGVGGTRHCDWWFSTDAVLIDTAGRYTTQDSDRARDRAAWTGFLNLLAKHRPRRPINGALVTVSVPDIQAKNPADQLVHAERLRARVDELSEVLGVRVPVYVLVTKTDLLPGFVEFFADVAPAERDQVWGFTLPHSDGAAADANDWRATLAAELGVLERRLNERMLARLQNGGDTLRSAAIYQFPQAWQSLKPELLELLTLAFDRGEAARERPWVRGVYFTSGTQEATAFDRVIARLARPLGVAVDASSASPVVGASGTVRDGPTGRSYFVRRLLTDVVFAEAGLVGTNVAWERRRARLRLATYAMVVAAVVAGLAYEAYAYRVNRAQVAALEPALARLGPLAAAARSAKHDDPTALVPLLDALAQFAPRDSSDGVWGWDQGERLHGAGASVYQRLLREALLPRLAARIESAMRADETRPETVYEALKAYLMLFGGKNYDRVALGAYLDADWRRDLPDDVRAALGAHVERLFASGEVGAPTQADAAAIARARSAVLRGSLPIRVYERVTRFGSSAAASTVSLASLAGPDAARIFGSAGERLIETPIPNRYTREGYRRTTGPALREVVAQLEAEAAWVLGAPMAVGGEAKLIEEIERRLATDYAQFWERTLADLRVKAPPDLKSTADLSRVLARSDSTLTSLVTGVAREVTLEGPGAAIVDTRFHELRNLARPQGLHDVLGLIGRLSAYLISVEDAIARQLPIPADNVSAELASTAARLPAPLREMLHTLSQASTRELATVRRDALSRAFSGDLIGRCAKLASGRYPLVRTATEEMTHADFAAIFGPGGTFDDFFRKHLASIVVTGAGGWSYRNGEGGSVETLRQFERARAIREAFFPEPGDRLGLNLALRLLDADSGIRQFLIDIDGQALSFSSATRGPRPFKWPGGAGPAQVRLAVEPPTPGGAGGFVFEGPWALAHVLDRVRVSSTGAPNRMEFQIDVEGRRARFELSTPAARLPFRLPELDAFRCPQGR